MKNFIQTLLLLAPFIIFSQSAEPKIPCATDALMQKLMREFPETRERLERLNLALKDATENRKSANSEMTIPAPGSITIPVVVYIVHDGSGSVNISDSRVTNQLAALNNYFFSTGIKFCLATKVNTSSSLPTVNSSDVQTTPGIIHVNNAALSNHFSSSQAGLVGTASPQIGRDRYLRIWVVKSIDGAGSGILGYSMYPSTSSIFDGVVMRYDVFGNGNSNMLANYNLGKVLAHEVGHYLFLYHTFDGGCDTSHNDCTLDGDHVCDTPAVAAPNFYCVSGTNSCPETPAVLDDLSNYMDYGNNLCQNHFTNGQILRMLAVLNTTRSVLVSTDNIIYTGTCGSDILLSATIMCNTTSPCRSSTMPTTFEALTAATYSWDFGDAFSSVSNPNTADTQIASHIYTSTANSPYTVTLTVTDENGNSRTSSELIYVSDCPPILNANSYWYVGSSNGIDFRTGMPVFDLNFPANNYANGSANSQCDASGNLLFYTNKGKVWNRQNAVISGVFLVLNSVGSRSTQVLCVPKPPATGNTVTQYYIFTQQHFNMQTSDIGFRYNIVNVSGTDATMGVTKQPVTIPSSYGFDTGTDGALLGGNCLSAVKKCGSNDYWIITLLKKGTVPYLVVFSLSNQGLVYSSEQLVVDVGTFFLSDSAIYIAPNGNKLALTHPYGNGNSINVYDFNKAEGILSSTHVELAIPSTSTPSYGQSFGGTFSPDSNLFYAGDYFAKKIYQFNINSINSNNTRVEVASPTLGPWSLKIGPDNKIYVTIPNDNQYSHLSVINNPNNIATLENPNACNFSVHGVTANYQEYRQVGEELPNDIDAKQETAYFDPNTPNVVCKYITACNTYKFFPNVCGTSFIWTFTNTTTGISVTSTDTDPTYNFSQNGTYIVTVKDSLNNLLGTSSPIVITTAPIPVITGSTSACLTRNNERVTNNSTALAAGESVTWSITGGTGIITGGTSNQPSVNINWTALPGTITLTKVSASGCTSTATRTITSYCAPLGIDDNLEPTFTIAPNPSKGLFVINSSTTFPAVSLTVHDIRGRMILSEENVALSNSGKTVDLTNCQAGIYLLRLDGPDFNKTFKIIKE